MKNKVSYFDYHSETIVQNLIEKILSLSIYKYFIGTIEDKIPNYCFQKMKQSIGAFAELQFITHDRDDYKNNITETEKIKKVKFQDNVKSDNIHQSAIDHRHHLQHLCVSDAATVHHLGFYAQSFGNLCGSSSAAMYQNLWSVDGAKVL